jgi:poly(hydroxyalkanoate) depolymerase family esterase
MTTPETTAPPQPLRPAIRRVRQEATRHRVVVCRWVCALALTCLLGACAASAQASSFTPGSVGDLDYYLFDPSADDGSRALPLVVYLHGCNQTAPDAAVGTRWNQQAEAAGFLVLYPQQSVARNSIRCWNFSDPNIQSRDGGEAKLIADATRDVMARHRIDARRVFVLGSSAGGAMSVVMAATYPDVYAAAANFAGCGFATCLDITGLHAYRAMGPRARPVPLLTAAGTLDLDPLWGFVGVTLGLPQWLRTSDLADDGMPNGSVSLAPASSVFHPATADSYPHVTQVYNDRHGQELVQFVTVIGGRHAYFGGDPAGSFTDPKGPALTPLAWAFLSRHPMPTARSQRSANR